MITIYDHERCPFCARARITLDEKGVPYETVFVDLDDRPAWMYEKNPLGKVPVLEEDTFLLPESDVIMELLEERHPEPALLPVDPGERALVRLAIRHFDHWLGDAYYAVRRREDGAMAVLEARLADLDRTLTGRDYLVGGHYGLADIAYFPWLPRAEHVFGVDLAGYPAVQAWVERLAERPAIAAELAVVSALAT
jgi:glutathione S-transferase